MAGLANKIIDLHPRPRLTITGDEILVQLVNLIHIMAAVVVEDNRQSDAIGIVDHLARGHGGHAHPEMAHRRNLREQRTAIINELLPGLFGGIGAQPEINSVNEHGGHGTD